MNTTTGPVSSYSWDFGDMSNSSAMAPLHAYAANGSYTVTLTAMNGNCQDVTTFTVNIAVGIDDLPNVALTLAPNPASNTCNVQLSGATLENIQMIDGFGRIVLESKENELLLDQISNGIYQVIIFTDKGNSIRKLIINK